MTREIVMFMGGGGVEGFRVLCFPSWNLSGRCGGKTLIRGENEGLLSISIFCYSRFYTALL